MPEILKDERKVVKKDNGKFVFILNQEQEYESITRDNMIAAWKKELKEKQVWIDKFDEVLETAKAQTESELNVMKGKIEKDIEYIKEGLKIWTTIIEDQ